MSKIGLAILLILMTGRNYAQQDYFVLIEADNNQPFYVRMEGKLFSSSAQGHLILSQLKEGVYPITIGFPKQRWTEQSFSLSINKKDLEFQLKDQGEKGWGLFNPQTLEFKMPDEKTEVGPKNHLEGVKKDDAFSRLMAGVVSDTAVMYNTYAMEATLKDSPVAPGNSNTTGAPVAGVSVAGVPIAGALGKDTSSIADTVGKSPTGIGTPKEVLKEAARLDMPLRSDTGTLAGSADTTKIMAVPGTGVLKAADSSRTLVQRPPVPVDSALQTMSPGKEGAINKSDSSAAKNDSSAVAPAVLPKAGPVIKLSERKTAKGVRLVYADHIRENKTDTIVVIIPVDTVTRLVQRPAEAVSPASPPAGSGVSVSVPAGSDHPVSTQSGAETPGQKTSTFPAGTTRPDSGQKKTPAPVRSLFINSDCRNFATEYDVDKLRVKMLEAGKEEDRISVAHKVFKSKCFSTRQIRALSEVFSSDAQKFRFLETAYPFVSDEHFKELGELLADPVYNSKFRTMTGQ